MTYNALKAPVKKWIEQELQWKQDEIVSILMKYGSYENEDKDGFKAWKHDNNIEVVIERNTRERQTAYFARLENGNWRKKRKIQKTNAKKTT